MADAGVAADIVMSALDADVIKTYLGLGFTFIAAAVDVDLMQWGAAELNKALRV